MKIVKNSWFATSAIFLWPFLFTGVTLGLGLFSHLVKGQEVHLEGFMLWNGGWLLWCGFSYLAIFLARRFPIDRRSFKLNVLQHLIFGLLFIVVLTLLEFSIVYLIRGLSEMRDANYNDLVGIFAYKSHINLVIYCAIVVATNAFDYYAKFQKSEITSTQLETKLAQAELQALKMQLHPHFLFNTHHSIISLMLKKENNAAIKMLTQLSDLLRSTLEKTSQQTSSLKEELDTLNLYLDIQKVRFKDRLEVEIDTDPNTLDAQVPFLVLQPIVENALQHGIDSLTTNGKIAIRAQRSGYQLELSVSDNGPGMGNGSGHTNGNGIGLKTTRARLEQLYGEHQSLTIESSPETGTKVSIKLPLSKTASSDNSL